ncbi:hypothetical protein IWQ54_000405 [Labrenzia sp. EL_195]|nr:hypothetical protein [Labrenzia sp. EL_195]
MWVGTLLATKVAISAGAPVQQLAKANCHARKGIE